MRAESCPLNRHKILDESPNATGSGRTQNAINGDHQVAVDLNDPRKPGPASVNKGYNEALDLPWADVKYSIKTYIFICNDI